MRIALSKTIIPLSPDKEKRGDRVDK